MVANLAKKCQLYNSVCLMFIAQGFQNVVYITFKFTTLTLIAPEVNVFHYGNFYIQISNYGYLGFPAKTNSNNHRLLINQIVLSSSILFDYQ